MLKRRIQNWILKHLYCAVTLDDVMSVILDKKSGTPLQIFFGGEQASFGEIRAMKEEIKFLCNTRLWKVLTASPAEQAKIRMFEMQKHDADMVFGKAMLYTLSLQKQLVKAIQDINV